MSSFTNKQKAAKRARQSASQPTGRPKAPRGNEKTVMCSHWERHGNCPWGNKCNFAHGKEELRSVAPAKLEEPCWYHNRGGCSKSAEECRYQHVDAPNMRKPLHLQHPCPYYHRITPQQCRRGSECGGDHDYELTAGEWKHHFPNWDYPGEGYLAPKTVTQKAPSPKKVPLTASDEFPVLGSDSPKPQPKTVVGGAWGKPLTFKEPEPTKEPEHEPTQTTQKECNAVRGDAPAIEYLDGPKKWYRSTVCERRVIKVSPEQIRRAFKSLDAPKLPAGTQSWADMDPSDDEEDEDDVPRMMVPPPPQAIRDSGSRPVESESADVDTLREQMSELSVKLTQLIDILSKSGTSTPKLPVVDNELKTLATRALKQLLES